MQQSQAVLQLGPSRSSIAKLLLNVAKHIFWGTGLFLSTFGKNRPRMCPPSYLRRLQGCRVSFRTGGGIAVVSEGRHGRKEHVEILARRRPLMPCPARTPQPTHRAQTPCSPHPASPCLDAERS